MSIETLRINSTNPCLILFLLDQSGSMQGGFGADYNTSKAEALANAVNETIHNIGLKCVDSGGTIKDRFEVAVMGYGTGLGNGVSSAYLGELDGRWVVPISELFEKPYTYNDDEAPIWIEPTWGGLTPMTRAFQQAYDLCSDWISYGNHINCHPPLIINITDGEATDSGWGSKKLITAVNQIKSLGTEYGNPFIFNIHISYTNEDQVLFPNSIEDVNSRISDTNASLLYELSSHLNEKMVNIGSTKGYKLDLNSKGFIFNGNSSDLINFLNIGSSPV
tara:strand:- start:113 stop:943 length:831 start_codon:yes stop_codon:yes gene_type:complete